MENILKKSLYKLLKKDSRLWDKEKKEFNETLLKDLIDKLDEKLIELLLSNKELKKGFFVKIKDVFVLKQNELKFFIDENKLDNSYTQYQNKIGLRVGNKLLLERNEVILDWPFKDCVLEGGMTKEDQKRDEIFFNEVLAKDEIDRLEDPKAFVGWKRYTAKGEKKVKELKRNKEGIIRENLIIKGNNLLALHSLKEQFTGKVKLIYIDPPFYFSKNKPEDTFSYNPNFKLSTWLTFTKNRLLIARDLLAKDGIIFVHVGSEDASYINMLLDEVFKHENYINHISVKTTEPAGFKTAGKKILNTANHIFVYKKENGELNKVYIKKEYDAAYKYILLNKKDNYTKWKYKTIKQHLIDKNPKIDINIIDKLIEEFALSNPDIVFRTTAITGGARQKREATIKKSFENKRVVMRHPNEDVDYFYILNGEMISFWENTYKNIDNEIVPAQSLSDIWTDISWTGIAPEGGVKLNNGKKPEKLLKRVIELGTKAGDIVLDYHLGSGTTCAVVHKMGRQFIGIEQLDYEDNDSIVRLKNVINGDQSGISKAVNWQGGGDFVYVELAKWNEEAKEKILKAKSLSELEKLFDELYERYFLNYNVKTKEFKEKIIKEEEFKKLSLNEQKKLFVEMLDMNQMYINFSERADKKYNLSKEDITLSEEFYNAKR